MGKLYAELDDTLIAFIRAQHMFFVGSAPLAGDGHVNISPKGLDTLRILGPRQVAYLDLTGSGIETVAHARENRRMTLMFCAFEGAPKILRLYGKARVHVRGSEGFRALAPHFSETVGARAVLLLDLTRIADSCGYAVPLYDFRGERNTLAASLARKGEAKLSEYRRLKNQRSIDGLPGIDIAESE